MPNALLVLGQTKLGSPNLVSILKCDVALAALQINCVCTNLSRSGDEALPPCMVALLGTQGAPVVICTGDFLLIWIVYSEWHLFFVHGN